jgi:hypothetical protein
MHVRMGGVQAGLVRAADVAAQACPRVCHANTSWNTDEFLTPLALPFLASGVAQCRTLKPSVLSCVPSPRDLPRLAELIGDWEVARWLVAVPYPYQLKDAEDFYERMAASVKMTRLNIS